jgi:peptidoglycan-associated lipoprotein
MEQTCAASLPKVKINCPTGQIEPSPDFNSIDRQPSSLYKKGREKTFIPGQVWPVMKKGGIMKRFLIFFLSTLLILSFSTSCKKKVKEVPPPPPPQAQEQPKVEKVETPTIKEPVLTEEEIFQKKTLEEINQEKPLAMIFFDYDKYNIREDAVPILEADAQWLKKHPTVKILIEGHCDERGTEEYNLALGERRAKSTMDYLISLGIPAERIRIISYGKSQPLDPGHDEAAWAKNRRAQFLIIEK